ncbi:AAA family ATPase [Moraxella nasovis]|uniref:AAA family ATPase n=1 Tax=Moraxella nasovis TaxID=2904121 RepID=UPI001F612C07|nr:AAA family ATPase [Moraxella nasovis]UNU74055.1 AAA family ATPase [Moraxella nasovis]
MIIDSIDPKFKINPNGFYKGRVTSNNIILTDDIDVHDTLMKIGVDVVFYDDINTLVDNAIEERKNIRIITQSELLKGGDKKFLVKMPNNPTLQSLNALFKQGGELNLICASDVKPMPIKWLWRGWLPLGKLTTFAGAGGSGKTTIALDLVRAITTGGAFPDGSICDNVGECVIYSTEDDIHDTLTPRLKAMGADLSKVHFVDSVMEKGEERYFDPSEDLPRLAEALQGRDVRLVMIDPILAVVSGNMHHANEVRASLDILVKMANELDFAIVGITHFAKGTKGQDPTERVIGSQAFTALARMAWVTAPAQEPDKPNIFTKTKTNIAKIDGGFEYFIEPCQLDDIDTTRIKWGNFKQGTTKELLNQTEQTEEEKEMSSADYAKQFLLEILLDVDDMKVSEIEQEAKEAGFTIKQIRSAREKVCNRPEKKKDGWYWSLKPAYKNHEPSIFIDLKN